MPGWTMHEGRAVALPLDNIDTDQLIPARFMSAPRSEGYGNFLLYDLRRGADGSPDPEFPLNRHDGASILVAGRNFGSGSSREAAVYALVDAGFRAVIGSSFGDIFTSNAVNNGLLPARVSEADAAVLLDALGGGWTWSSIDLNSCEIRVGSRCVHFELDKGRQAKLINGWDDIDLTLQHRDDIKRFREDRSQTAPWAWPRAASATAG